MNDRGLFRDNRLDFRYLGELASRPRLFAPHEDVFWNDPHISEQMLAAHLDPNTDAASRRPETIDRTVSWLVSHLDLQAGQRVLDLGCGPGLYCERLARRGLEVTGVDFSPRSIDYARRSVERQNLKISYVGQDYTRLDLAGEFDVAILIYFDFGVLSNSDRDEVLRRVHRALKPGGCFVFDVVAAKPTPELDGARTWSISEGGFWKPGLYLELLQQFVYPEADASVRQTIIVEADGRVSRYRIWERRYSPESIATVLNTVGFQVESIWGDLTGQPYVADVASFGVVARRT